MRLTEFSEAALGFAWLGVALLLGAAILKYLFG